MGGGAYYYIHVNNFLYIVVSLVSGHGCSTITPNFSLPWVPTWCTWHLPCAKLCCIDIIIELT